MCTAHLNNMNTYNTCMPHFDLENVLYVSFKYRNTACAEM